MGNNAEDRKHHYVYRMTYKPTGQWYVGVHSTDNLKDKYRGSGRSVMDLIARDGGDHNFEMEIVSNHRTRNAALARERKLIGKSYRDDPSCLNRQEGGGSGGKWDDETRRRINKSRAEYFEQPGVREKMSETAKAVWNRPGYRENAVAVAKKRFEDPEERRKASEAAIKRFSENPEIGRAHSRRMKEYYSDPANRKANSERVKKAHRDNPEIAEKLSAAQRAHVMRMKEAGLPHSNAKPILARGKPYASFRDAEIGIEVTRAAIKNRIEKGWDGYSYLTVDEYLALTKKK